MSGPQLFSTIATLLGFQRQSKKNEQEVSSYNVSKDIDWFDVRKVPLDFNDRDSFTIVFIHDILPGTITPKMEDSIREDATEDSPQWMKNSQAVTADRIQALVGEFIAPVLRNKNKAVVIDFSGVVYSSPFLCWMGEYVAKALHRNGMPVHMVGSMCDEPSISIEFQGYLNRSFHKQKT